MKIGIIVFAYNRSVHLSRTLEALRKNEGIDSIYVFQDGLKEEAHREEWERTKAVICSINWCEVNYFFSEENKGLKQSILDGVNYVFRENDAIVVLEDDCVVTANFMSFMRQSLIKYEECKQVYSVSGYAWPLDFSERKYDAYFCGRISSWGWGTWKDRWQKLELNYEMMKEMRADRALSEELAIWGNDFEDILVGNIREKTDSWAIFWALSVIRNKGLCLNPYESLVLNIGFDGTGVHCGNEEQKQASLMKEEQKIFKLPDEMNFAEVVKLKFSTLFGGIYCNKETRKKEAAVVYGLGNFYKQNEQYINGQYDIVMFIDKGKKGYYAGKKIGKMNDIQNASYDVILLMFVNLNDALQVARELHNYYSIPYNKMILGKSIIEKDCLIRKLSDDGKIVLDINGYSFYVGTCDEYEKVKEVFKNHIYQYYVNDDKKNVVFDVGGVLGDSALYFLLDKNTKKVYIYDPFPDTYMSAERNLDRFLNSGRMELNQYGISSRTEQRGMIKVRKASEVFEPLIKEHRECNLVLKMDCEWEEYEILKELKEAGILEKFKFVMLEWHYKKKERLIEELVQAGFSYWCINKSADIGLIYAYRC